MDPASKVLAKARSSDTSRTWVALSEWGDVPLHTLYYRARGRPSREEKAQRQQYLTADEEKALVTFLLQMSSLGQPVRIKYIPSLAFSVARRRSTPNKPIKPPGKNWARAFEKRQPEVRARRIRSIDWNRHEKFIHNKITEWFEVIDRVLQGPSILPENVYNMDETGVMLSMLGSVKVLVGKDDVRGYRGAGVKRTMVTAVECISADGRSLLPLIIWPSSTHRSNWTTLPTPGWHYGHSENGYNDSKICLEWLTRVFDAQTRGLANGKPRLLICDGFGTHETLEILEFCFEHNIILCRLPSHTSHKLQPCDVGVVAPLKTAYRDEVERLNRGGVDKVGKEHFTYLYQPARDRALTKRNIKAAWAATGLFPFDPKRVLRDIPKPPLTELTVPDRSDACLRDELLTPVTPVTPVTTEGLSSLHNLIKEDACASERLQRRVQKLASAAQISFAKQHLLQDHNRLLAKINGEAKVRRSTKSVVLGKAKVMSFEDLEVARVKRATKDKATADKGKGERRRKRKNPAPEVGETEVMGEAAGKSDGKCGRKRKKSAPEVNVVEIEIVSEPWRAPVARMY
jgi:hypothetical protein